MPPTVATTPYFEPGVTKAWFVPTIAAATLIPTAAEVNGGTALHGGLKQGGIENFDFTNNLVPYVVLNDNFEAKAPGLDVVGAATLRFVKQTASEGTIKTAMQKGTVGHIVIFGPGVSGGTNAVPAAAATDKCDVWKGVITSTSNDHPTGNAVAEYHMGFGVTARPAQDVACT